MYFSGVWVSIVRVRARSLLRASRPERPCRTDCVPIYDAEDGGVAYLRSIGTRDKCKDDCHRDGGLDSVNPPRRSLEYPGVLQFFHLLSSLLEPRVRTSLPLPRYPAPKHKNKKAGLLEGSARHCILASGTLVKETFSSTGALLAVWPHHQWRREWGFYPFHSLSSFLVLPLPP